MDRRVKKTERAFMQALLHFLEEKDIKQITVKELCDHADMNRSTFYLHYLDIYDLLDKTEQNMVDAIYTPINKNNSRILYDILSTFEYIKEHKKDYRVIFSVNMGSGFVRKLTNKVTEHIIPHIKEMLPDYPDDVARSAAVIHVGGAMALLHDWVINHDCSIPPITILNAVIEMTDRMYKERYYYHNHGGITISELKDYEKIINKKISTDK